MPMPVLELPVQSTPQCKRWTRAEYESLFSSGVLHDQSLELIEGELISKMGKNQPHVNSVTILLAWLMQVFGPRCVYQEAPIEVAPSDSSRNVPQPDLAVLNRDLSAFRAARPCPEDLHLAIEVSDTSLGFDLRTKAALYARAGIADYWVLDLTGRRMIVHRNPRDGQYLSVVAYAADERVAPLAAPDSSLLVSDAFAD